MPVQLRLPDISGNDKEQLVKIRSYLYKLIPELQFALNNIGTAESTVVTQRVIPSYVMSDPGGAISTDGGASFEEIKALIIKSAEIVDAYYEEINRRLESVYVAQSDFGNYAQETAQTIEENSTSTTQGFENVQTIMTENGSRIADIDEDLQESKAAINNSIQGVQDNVTGVNALLEDAKAQLQGSLDDLEVDLTGLKTGIEVGAEVVVIGVTATIKSGLLYTTDEGIPVYGIEIGQSVKDAATGTEVFSKYARFTSEKLSFFDSNGYEVAYVSDKKLFIKMAEITVSLQIGKFIDLVMDNGDVVTKWLGG